MKSIKRYFKLSASPADVYNALTNQLMIEIWTGEKAVFKAEPGTDFSMWDGAIFGKNVKFDMDKLIKQTWFFDDVESEVTIKLHAEKKYTNVELRQDNIPDDVYENISEGWDMDYFGALQALFNE